METNGRTQLCRNLAAIRRIGTETETPDSLFVLLNPGQCLPASGEDSIPFAEGPLDELPLMEAKPDYTLRQLMRLMERMKWDYVQVINLTDLRSGKFIEFKETQQYMLAQGDSRHSIFSPERRSELESCVAAAGTVIAGWGTESYIRKAAGDAYALLSELRTVHGLPHQNHPLYYHPFPWIKEKCIQWLDDMENQLNEAAGVFFR